MRRAGALIAIATLASLAGVALLVATPAGAETAAVLRTFSDGTGEQELHFEECPPVTSNVSANITLPFDALVTAAQFNFETLRTSTASNGTWGLEDNAGARVVLPIEPNGLPRTAEVDPTYFNGALASSNATAGTVEVALRFWGCPSGGDAHVRISNLSVSFVISRGSSGEDPGTMYDGEFLLHFGTCPPIGYDLSVVLPFPHDANVTSVQFDYETLPNSSALGGSFGPVADPTPWGVELPIGYAGSTEIDGASITDVLQQQRESPGNVSVAIAFWGCPSDGSAVIRLHNFVLRYTVPAVPNRPAVVNGTIPDLVFGDGGLPRVPLDLSAYFQDPDGDPLTYGAEWVENGTVGAPEATFGFNGGVFVLDPEGLEPGVQYALRFFAADPGGNRTYGNVVGVLLEPPAVQVPSVELVSPAVPELLTNATAWWVEVHTDAPEAHVLILVDGEPESVLLSDPLVGQPASGVYAHRVLLELVADALPHRAEVFVVGADGHFSAASFTYRSWTVPPPLDVATAVVPGPSGDVTVWVNGTTDPGVVGVTVSGQEAALTGGGFAVPLALPTGPSPFGVDVVVRDAFGNARTAHLVVWYSPPPRVLGILVLSASAGELTETETASLRLETDRPLPGDARVTWFLDDDPVARVPEPEDLSLPPGRHVLSATVGNQSWDAHIERAIEVAAAPDVPAAGGNGQETAAAVAVVGLAAAGGLLAATQAGRYFVLFALVGTLVRRGKPASPLDHFVRGRIFQLIKENPGVHYSELRRETGLSNSAMTHHLRVLERAGLVRPLIDGAKTRFFLTDRPLDDTTYGLSDGDRAVLSAVGEEPGLTEGELSDRLDRSLSVVNRAVDRLGALGYVRKERQGRAVLVYPRPASELPPPAVVWPEGERRPPDEWSLDR